MVRPHRWNVRMITATFSGVRYFSDFMVTFIWARSWENVSYAICEQPRRRSACASAQSDQRLFCSLPRQNDTSSLYIRNFKILAGLCSWAGQFVSCLVGDSRRHIFSWRSSFSFCQDRAWRAIWASWCCHQLCDVQRPAYNERYRNVLWHRDSRDAERYEISYRGTVDVIQSYWTIIRIMTIGSFCLDFLTVDISYMDCDEILNTIKF